MSVGREFLQQAINSLQNSKELGDRTLNRLNINQLNWTPNEESNSIAIIVKHLHGNMVSRWTDFLTTDGEKPTRDRDSEFVGGYTSKEALLQAWEEGWAVSLQAIRELQPDDLLKTVTIRGVEHSVIQAILRHVAHSSYHVGQIVHIAKQLLDKEWVALTIPRKK